MGLSGGARGARTGIKYAASAKLCLLVYIAPFVWPEAEVWSSDGFTVEGNGRHIEFTPDGREVSRFEERFTVTVGPGGWTISEVRTNQGKALWKETAFDGTNLTLWKPLVMLPSRSRPQRACLPRRSVTASDRICLWRCHLC